MRSLCRACGRAFSGATGFDAHRINCSEVAGPPKYGRGCITDAELEAIGYTLRYGVWMAAEAFWVAQGDEIVGGPVAGWRVMVKTA